MSKNGLYNESVKQKITVIGHTEKNCVHNWHFVKGGLWKDDKAFYCPKCGSWRIAAKHDM